MVMEKKKGQQRELGESPWMLVCLLPCQGYLALDCMQDARKQTGLLHYFMGAGREGRERKYDESFKGGNGGHGCTLTASPAVHQ